MQLNIAFLIYENETVYLFYADIRLELLKYKTKTHKFFKSCLYLHVLGE